MVETSSMPKTGVSAFERVRLALVYIEAAADLPAEMRYGDRPALKHLLRELAVRASILEDGMSLSESGVASGATIMLLIVEKAPAQCTTEGCTRETWNGKAGEVFVL